MGVAEHDRVGEGEVIDAPHAVFLGWSEPTSTARWQRDDGRPWAPPADGGGDARGSGVEPVTVPTGLGRDGRSPIARLAAGALAAALGGALGVALLPAWHGPRSAGAAEAGYGLVRELDLARVGITEPWRTAATTDGDGVCVLDGGREVWMLAAADGRVLWRAPAAGAQDVTCPTAANAFVINAPWPFAVPGDVPTVTSLSAEGHIWSHTVDPDLFGNLSLRDRLAPAALAGIPSRGSVLVLDAGGPRVLELASASGKLLADNAVLRPDELADPLTRLEFDWLTDVADASATSLGDLAVLNNEQSLVALVSLRRGSPRGSVVSRWWQVPPDGRRLAVAPDGGVFVLFDEGTVRGYDRSGETAAEWLAAGARDPRQPFGDLVALGPGDEVAVLDSLGRRLLVYATGERAAADESLSRCAVRAAKEALPATIELGQTVEVALSIEGECRVPIENTDVVLIVDRFGTPEELARRTDDARALLAALAEGHDRAAVIEVTTTARRVADLSYDLDGPRDALRSLVARPDTVPRASLAMDDALRHAADVLPKAAIRNDRRALIIVWATDDYCRYWSPASDGQMLRARGIRLGLVDASGNGAAGVPPGIGGLPVIGQRMVATNLRMIWRGPPGPSGWSTFVGRWTDHRAAGVLLARGTISDVLPANMQFVAGSAVPAAFWDAPSRTLAWRLVAVTLAGVAVRYRLQPRDAGTWSTNYEARATYVDGLGASGEVVFPVPRIRVLVPTPSATATAEATPTAAATPGRVLTPPSQQARPARLYLPNALCERCRSRHEGADVALADDTSGSMTGRKLEAPSPRWRPDSSVGVPLPCASAAAQPSGPPLRLSPAPPRRHTPAARRAACPAAQPCGAG
jgi:Mg-chelatase subunit ChlD